MPKAIDRLTETARAAGMPAGGYVPCGQISWKVDRYHVGTSALAVARDFWHRIARSYPRPIKRAIVRVALRHHAANRGLYRAVMSGRLYRVETTCRKPRAAGGAR
jgi:hypothetical protein